MNPPVQVPEKLIETVKRVHGEAGRRWLADADRWLSECRTRWSLELGEPFENLSYHLVVPGRMPDGTDIVLKIGVPCRELLTEAAALELFQGVGAVRLLEHDARRGILLLERLSPGTPLYESQDDSEATSVAAALMRRLWRNTPAQDHPFPSLANWFQAFERLKVGFDGGSGPFPPDLIQRAENTFIKLNASSDSKVVLHGDLHHANILLSQTRGWVAIDPKGIVGDAGYEVGSFMLNQLPLEQSQSVVIDILSRRLSIFSRELRIERGRLARWAFCHAVLSALWDFEEAAEWEGTIRLARMLERLV
jgi:streptomycin 6-kinase